MAGLDLSARIVAVICLWLWSWSQPAIAREPAAAGCIDLKELSGGWRSGERQILIRSKDRNGARLELDPACPVFPEGVDLETLADEGWACPGRRMFVRGGNTICPVIEMKALSESGLADALRARDAHLRAIVTLDQVVVKGHHWRDIRGSTNYCVDARFLRGWREDSNGLVVEVAPRRHSGHRYYRIETAGTCSDLTHARSIRLVSRSGGAAVCGYAGDKVMLVDYSSGGFTQMGGTPTKAFDLGCEISRVTPLP